MSRPYALGTTTIMGMTHRLWALASTNDYS